MSEALKALAANIIVRRHAGLDPYIVFIGAGASISSGCSSMLDIANNVLELNDSAQFNIWQKEVSEADELNAKFGDLLRNEIKR